ncbi:MAG: translation initiation factor [bacterium]|nr:translation initiation factor [bacterium]
MGLFDGTPLERPVLCEICGLEVKVCKCEPVASDATVVEVPPSQQRPSLRVEKRKRGKQVTLVAGLLGSPKQQQQLLTELKNLCGAGGSMETDAIAIQGKHLERIGQYLKQQGYRLK